MAQTTNMNIPMDSDEIGGDIPNEETQKAIEDARNGIGLSRAFSSVRELMEDLNSDD